MTGGAMQGTRIAGRAQVPFWSLYDLAFACLALVTVSEAFLALGLGSLMWLAVYGMAALRMALALSGIATGVLRNGALLLYPAVGAASILWSASPSATLVDVIQLGVTMSVGLFLGLRYSLAALLSIAFWVATALVALSVANVLTGALGVSAYDVHGRVTGVFENKSYLSRQALIATLTGLALILSRDGRAGPATKAVAAVAVPTAITMIALSQSMTHLLMVPCAIALFLLLCQHMLPRMAVFGGVAAALVIVLAVPVVFTALGVGPAEALLELTGKDSTLTGRTVIWDIALREMSERPLLGAGLGAIWEAPQFATERFAIRRAGAESPSLHNFVLEIGVATGIAGLAAMAVFLGAVLRRTLLVWRIAGTPFAAAALTLIVIFTLLSLNTPGLAAQHEIQILLFTALGVSAQGDLAALGRGLRRRRADAAPPDQPRALARG